MKEKKATVIDLGFLSKEAADKVEKVLDGQTFMDFKVYRGVVCGPCITVQVSTTYRAPFKEIAGFALYALAEGLAK